jgi:tetratricopeptide (TPR) repeat protein
MPSSQASRHKSKGAGRHDRLDAALLTVVDAALGVCVFGLPLVMGGRHPLGHLLLVVAAAVAALAWMFRQAARGEFRWRRSPADWLLPAGLAVLVLQLAPLGDAILARLSPVTGKVLPLWTEQAEPGATLGLWSCVSMTPAATRAAIPLYLAYVLLVLVAVQRLKTLEDIERLLAGVALSAVLVASLALLQWATGTDQYLWVYDYPFSPASDGVKGTFSNHNHFAHFLALGLGPLLAWLLAGTLARRAQAGMGRRKKPEGFDSSALRVLALAVVAFAGLMSLSRGGAVALLVAAAMAVAVGCWAGLLGRRAVLGLAGTVVLTAVALTIYGYDKVQTRLGDLTAGSLEAVDANRARRVIWAADAKAVPHYLALGAGVGSHAAIYPTYLTSCPACEYTHAECSPLQLLLEAGVGGLGLMAVAIGLAAFWCVAALRAATARLRTSAVDAPLAAVAASGTRAPPGAAAAPPSSPQAPDPRRLLLCVGAVSAGLAADVAHALVDFVWYVPACMALVALLAVAAHRLWQLARDPSGRRFRAVAMPQPVALAGILVVTLGAAWAVAERVGPVVAQTHWDAYLRLDLAGIETAANRPKTVLPASRDLLAGNPAATASTVQQIAELEEVLRWVPDHARAHLRLAEAYLRHFELAQVTAPNAMPLAQIGEAVVAAGFASPQAVDEWLARAVGERRAELGRARDHARTAASLSPLDGDSYVLLANLCFLDGSHCEAARAAYIAQALAVRPCEGSVLLEAGKQAVLTGNLPQAVDYWRQAFQRSAVHRAQIIECLAGRVPIAHLLAAFHPDLDALRAFHARYAKWAEPAQSAALCQVYHQCTGNAALGGDDDQAAARGWIDDQLGELRRAYLGEAQAEAARLQGAAAARAWLEAASLCGQMGDRSGELEAVERAARADPSQFPARYEAARCLVAAARYADAQPHLNWCLQRRPNDARLHALLHEVVAKRAEPPEAAPVRR